jgi:hypothetical protein
MAGIPGSPFYRHTPVVSKRTAPDLAITDDINVDTAPDTSFRLTLRSQR